MSGLIRRATLALVPTEAATSFSACNSDEDSTLNMRTSAFKASRISSALLPTPAKTIFEGETPALSARKSSPPDTISTPLPSLAMRRRMAILEFAFMAKAITWGTLLKAPS